jgi:hypothetical protein
MKGVAMDAENLRKISQMDQQLAAGLIAVQSQAQMLGKFRTELIAQGFSRKDALDLCNTFLSTTLWTAAEANRAGQVIQLGDDDDE